MAAEAMYDVMAEGRNEQWSFEDFFTKKAFQTSQNHWQAWVISRCHP